MTLGSCTKSREGANQELEVSKRLIINADDFGWDVDTSRQTMLLFERGAITSATILLGCPATEMAIEFACKNAHRFSFGLHFNIVDRKRPFAVKAKSSLTANGLFPPSDFQRLRALAYMLDGDELREELRAQLRELTRGGVRVSHIDSHGHLHKYPSVISAISCMLQGEGAYAIRLPQSLFQGFAFRKRLQNRYFARYFKKLKTTDQFFMLERHNDPAWFERFLRQLHPGTTELGIHPGDEEEWRKCETAPFLDSRFCEKVEKAGVCFSNYSDL